MLENKKALPKSITVELGDEKVEVKKLPLGKYAELMLALQNLPSDTMVDLMNLETEGDDDNTFQVIFGLFGKAWGQILEIISIGSGIDKDKIENDPNIGLDGGIELFIAIYEVNNLQKVVTKVKNVLNRSKK